MDKITNYDSIKNMSVEEMAQFIRDVQINADNNLPKEWKENEKLHCKMILNWLESCGFNG